MPRARDEKFPGRDVSEIYVEIKSVIPRDRLRDAAKFRA